MLLRPNPIQSNEPLEPVQVGWLAGIIDGESWLGLKIEPNRKRYPVLQVEMTDYPTLVRVHDMLKRFGSPRWTNLPARGHSRPAYRVTLRRPESIIALLDTVQPHLVTKRSAARMARLAALNNIKLRKLGRSEQEAA